ncbi:PIN domain-containing protein [Kiritimatiellaeota bacterium B1221]|nr:PIN domain-containing protein [Kiritimatiellaeota bacterium B1221]
MFLLDVNVLIALMDPQHQHHTIARHYFPQAQAEGWATCPLTENGLVRILSHSAYPNGDHHADTIREMLATLCQLPGHQFWDKGLSLTDKKSFPNLPVSKKLTDMYLLALAISYGGKLITFDKRINPGSLVGGKEAHWVLSEA